MTATKLSIHDFIETRRAAGRSKLNRFAHEIEGLRERGFSRHQIAEYLVLQGVTVNLNYLSNWMAKRDQMTPKQRAILDRDFAAAQMYKETEPSSPVSPTPQPADDGPQANTARPGTFDITKPLSESGLTAISSRLGRPIAGLTDEPGKSARPDKLLEKYAKKAAS